MSRPVNNVSNAELAKMFFDVLISTSTNHTITAEQERLIEDCPQNIAEAFAARRTLEGFKIRRLHAKYYPLLEMILRDGTGRAKEIAIQSDVAKQRSRQFKGIPGSSSAHVRSDGTSGGWEDGVKGLNPELWLTAPTLKPSSSRSLCNGFPGASVWR
jgi:hypothetical protein